MKILFLSLLCVFYCLIAFPQDRVNTGFGKVSIEDFAIPNSTVVDSNSNAVILYNIGSITFIGNERRYFSYVYKIHSRIRIMNDKASDLFTVKIRLYGSSEDKDKLSDLKAATYNIENGKIQTAALDEKDVFEDKLNPFVSDKKFTFPAARKGSIIEYSYTITSDYVEEIPGWAFQSIEYPCLYSEFKAIFPDALRYLTIRYGLDSFSTAKISQVKNHSYTLGDLTIVSNDIMGFWAMKDVPAFTPENYMDSPNDYLDKIQFSLAKTYNGEDVTDRSATWEGVTDRLLDTHYFGAAVDKESSVNLLKTAETITAGDKDPAEFARHIYYYVRNNFTCIPDDEIYASEDLYTVNKKKGGGVAEINLLLTALLRQKGILADPVILSTRAFGKNNPDYPVLEKMNYVICMMRLAGDTVYLDASRPDLGFGNLSIDCYNGHARIISKNGGSIYFLPEKIAEQKITSVFIYNHEKGKLNGSFQCAYGIFGSEKLRKDIKGIGQIKFFDDIKSSLPGETEITNIAVDSLKKPDFPASVHFEFKIPVSDNIVYVNPVIRPWLNENPFPAEQRRCPVVLPYPLDDVYTLNMEIPEGFEVDELPKSAKVSFNDGEGSFEYLIEKDQDRIQFRTRIKLSEMVFPAEDYNSLRDFFAFIIKKYGEQVVLKRK